MMKKANYVRDSKKFWRTREKARDNLDKRLANLSYSEKVTIMGKMQANHASLRNAKRVIKSSPKASKT